MNKETIISIIKTIALSLLAATFILAVYNLYTGHKINVRLTSLQVQADNLTASSTEARLSTQEIVGYINWGIRNSKLPDPFATSTKK